MLYLVLAIISSSLISILMRFSEKYTRNNISVLAMNYLMCALLGGMLAGPARLFPSVEGLSTTLLLGAIGGVLYLSSFVLLRWNISRNGIVLSTTFMKLGILVPTLMSIIIFGETPRATQLIGVAAAILAILLIQGKGGAQETTRSPGLLVILLLGGGMSDGMSKIFEEIAPAELSNHFLFYIFTVALVLCILLCIYKKQSLTPADAIFGLLIGVPNYLSSRFLLRSLSDIPAVVAFPSFSVGTIVVVAAAGVILFRERLSKKKIAALLIILASLVLLNI